LTFKWIAGFDIFAMQVLPIWSRASQRSHPRAYNSKSDAGTTGEQVISWPHHRGMFPCLLARSTVRYTFKTLLDKGVPCRIKWAAAASSMRQTHFLERGVNPRDKPRRGVAQPRTFRLASAADKRSAAPSAELQCWHNASTRRSACRPAGTVAHWATGCRDLRSVISWLRATLPNPRTLQDTPADRKRQLPTHAAAV